MKISEEAAEMLLIAAQARGSIKRYNTSSEKGILISGKKFEEKSNARYYDSVDELNKFAFIKKRRSTKNLEFYHLTQKGREKAEILKNK